MCGLAYLSLKNKIDFNVLKETIKILDSRGKDSWGFVAINSAKKSIIHEKNYGRIKNFSTFTNLYKLNNQGYTKFIMHSRLATSGLSSIQANIQPVCLENQFYLAHNGLILFDGEFDSFSFSDTNLLAKNLFELQSGNFEKYLNERKGEITTIFSNNIFSSINAYSNVGGLYEIKGETYHLLISEPIHSVKSKKIIIKNKQIPVRKLLEISDD